MFVWQLVRNDSVSAMRGSSIHLSHRLCRRRGWDTDGKAFLMLTRSAPTTLPFLHSCFMYSSIAIIPSSVEWLGQLLMCAWEEFEVVCQVGEPVGNYCLEEFPHGA